MLIQLFRANSDNSESVYDKWMIPLDLCSLATHLHNTLPDVEVEIIDGQVVDKDVLLSKINSKADVVGIAYTVFSVNSMEKIARIAKENGSFVVVGGQAATATAENLLSNHDIDAVVKYDGEIPLSMLVERIGKNKNSVDLGDIPNIVFRTPSGIGYGPKATTDIGVLPIPLRNIGGVNIEDYVNAYSTTCTEKLLKAKRPTNAYSKKGCPRSCSFCGRVDKSFRPRRAEIVYEEYKDLLQNHKVDYIYDHSDTWINQKWMDEFAAVYNKRGSLDLKYMVFADVRDIDRRVANQLREFGVDIVLLGLESGSEKLLKKNGKALSKEAMRACVSILSEQGIKVSASFVLGMIGETNDTIEETLSFISEIRTLGEVTIYCNLIIPLPGSWQWNLMMKDPEIYSRYHGAYNFDIEELRELYINKFTNVRGGLYYLREMRDMVLRKEEMPILEYAR